MCWISYYDLVFLEDGCLLLLKYVKVARSVFCENNFWVLISLLYYVTKKHPIFNRRKVFLIHFLLELVYLCNNNHAICTETCLLHVRLVNMYIIVPPACVWAVLLLLLCMVVLYAIFLAESGVTLKSACVSTVLLIIFNCF